MMRALAIADDFSGAAEIAGIGARYGLPTTLTRRAIPDTTEGLSVIDTDSRSLTPTGAAQAVTTFAHQLDPAEFDLIYKKTDSLMRGPVIAEIVALMRAFNRTAAILVAQNPS